MESNKNAKLIVLIMLGVSTILLFVCIFSLINLKKQINSSQEPAEVVNTSKVENIVENTANEIEEREKNKVKNNVKENIVKNETIENKVEIVDVREEEKVEEPEEGALTEIDIDIEDEWYNEGVEYRTVDVDAYEKEFETQNVVYSKGEDEYVLTYNVPTDFPLKFRQTDHKSTKFYFSEGQSIILTVDFYYGSSFINKHTEEAIRNREDVHDFKKIKTNKLTGYELFYEANDRYFFDNYSILTEPDENEECLIADIQINKRFNSTEDFDLNEFVNSEDFQYLLASIKVYKK